MSDQYKDRILGVNAPARSARAITPSDTVDIDVCRAVIISVAGDIKATFADDTAAVTFSVGAGEHSFMLKRVWSTGTTATGIVALY